MKNNTPSKYKLKDKKFKFSQKSCLLTYPHTDTYNISKKELGDYLYHKFNCIIIVVFEEHINIIFSNGNLFL